MSGSRILRYMALAVAALLILLVIGVGVITQTDWFRNFVKEKIISATEDGTGGRAEIGSFTFDWSQMRAVVTDFVIHGTEPEGSAPFVRVKRVTLDIRLLTGLHHLYEITYLGIEQPQANLMVFPDGRTNVPVPKKPSTSNTTALETVVDLAVRRFELANGLVVVNAQKQDLNLRGDNLRAQLSYSTAKQGYEGQLSLEPLYVVAGRNTPVKFALSLPVTLERDRIDVRGAKISTPESQLNIDASMENLRNLKTSAHISGHIAVADLKNAGGLQADLATTPALSAIGLDANATVTGDAIDLTGLRLSLGSSTVEASGKLKDPQGNGSLDFTARLALGELGRLAKVASRPDGTIGLTGKAKMDASNNYLVDGNLQAKNVSLDSGSSRIRDINLTSKVHLDPHLLNLTALKLGAFGGEFTGDASLADFERYELKGNLRHLDLGTVAGMLGQKDVPYSGVASGPIAASGDLKAPGTKSIVATARVSIEPGARGVPVSGRLFGDFSGATDDVTISDSYVTLPHSRLTLSGSVRNRLDIALTTRDLNDLLAALPAASRPHVSLNAGGQASVTGVVTGGLTSPRVTAHLAADRFTVEERRFDNVALDASASASGAKVSNGKLNRGPMQADFTASAGLRDWKATPSQPLFANVSIRDGDLADVMVLAGQKTTDYSGALSATVNVNGTIGNPLGTASVLVKNGMVQGEPFDQIQLQARMTDQLITIPTAQITAGNASASLTAEYQHPRDSFSTGRVHAHVQTSRVNLAQLKAMQKYLPKSSGDVQIEADVAGTAAPNKFLLTSVNADASARNLRFDGQNYGDFQATARTSGQTVAYNVVSDFAGSRINVKGRTELTPAYPTTADATIANLPIERILVLAKRTDIPAKGMLSSNMHFSGTAENPQGSGTLDLKNAVLYDEPIDQAHARISYLEKSAEISEFDATSGNARVDLSAKYDHPAGSLETGNLQFKIDSSRIDLARIRNVQKQRPGLGGILQLNASGAARVSQGKTRVLLQNADANLSATGLTMQGKNLGGLKLTANTAQHRLNFVLNSDLAGAAIQGHGYTELNGDYPLNASLSFSNVAWTRLQPLLQPDAAVPIFDAVVDGEATINGVVQKTEDLRGSVKLTRLNLLTVPTPAEKQSTVIIENQGPIVVSLDRGQARITSFHLTGRDTDIQAHGTASINGQALDLNLDANADLALAKRFDHDIVSAGKLVLTAAVRGSASKPQVNGRLELHNASVNYARFPNGLSNANGLVLFNGNAASIQNLTAESGGGKITMGGFVAFREGVRFGLRASATNVRVRPQEGISTAFDANVNLSGTTQASNVTGTVTIDRITYAPQSDFGSILSRSTPNVETPAAPSPLLDAMKLDLQVRTSPGTAVRTSLAQNLQADVDLRIRGTASQPGVLGRVSITEGQVVFFGSTYTVNTGTVSFYDPFRIEPVLNLSLETQTKGVDVVLRVTGPVDNMKLSYTSDPPLQFQEIVQLLASGKTPTSDPTLLANQPAEPTQSFAQMGESAVVSKAIAEPVAGQLQRVFGVSQLKIDPAFTSGSDLPQARVTLQQRISNKITFTYVTALNDPNTQILRVEWALNQQWSAIGTRDQNGIFSVRFLYKKQFR